MPFTFSHPAIVLPLINKRIKIFSASALIIGSIAPDFESFINVTDSKINSHTWPGMFWYDLPLAFTIWILFNLVVKDPLISNLPRPLEERFHRYKNFDWFTFLKKNFLIVVLSLLVGIASHLLWDAFTHLNLRYPDAVTSRAKFMGKRVYIILQYSCSLLGLAAIVWVTLKMPRTRVKKASTTKFKYWLFVFLLAALVAAFWVTSIFKGYEAANDYYISYTILAIYICISSFLAALTLVSLGYKILYRKQAAG